MPTTGYRFATSNSVISGTWGTLTNAYADDGTVATCTIAAKNTTSIAQYGTYGFSTGVLPDAAVIQTVNLRVEWRVANAGGVAFQGCRARIVTTDTTLNEDSLEPTTLTVRTYDITAHRAWVPADFRDGTFFTRLEMRTGNNATNPAFEIDYIAVEVIYAVPPTISDVETTETFVHGQTGVTIQGTGFESTQGTGKVELASTNTYASATKVLQTVTDWSPLGIAIEFTANILGLTPGTLFLFVTSTSGGVSLGMQVTVTFPPGAAWREALNTPTAVNVTSGNVQLRLRVGFTNSGSIGATAYKWQYRKNAGTWTDITASSSNVKTFATSEFAEGDDVPQLITGGSYQLDNNAAEESTGAFTLTAGLGGSTSVESEIALEVITADVANTDTLEFRMLQANNTVFDTYTQIPSMTITKGVAAVASLVMPHGLARRIGQLY